MYDKILAIVQTTFKVRKVKESPISVAERSKERVCGRSLAGVAGSNLAGGMDVCVICRKGLKANPKQSRWKNYG